tara:strand:- start:57 stop:491 length:435 start_codon:yes stop_codon:yes gene_type:complete
MADSEHYIGKILLDDVQIGNNTYAKNTSLYFIKETNDGSIKYKLEGFNENYQWGIGFSFIGSLTGWTTEFEEVVELTEYEINVLTDTNKLKMNKLDSNPNPDSDAESLIPLSSDDDANINDSVNSDATVDQPPRTNVSLVVLRF